MFIFVSGYTAKSVARSQVLWFCFQSKTFYLQHVSSESETAADVLLMKHEKVSRMAASRCAAAAAAHLHTISL